MTLLTIRRLVLLPEVDLLGPCERGNTVITSVKLFRLIKFIVN